MIFWNFPAFLDAHSVLIFKTFGPQLVEMGNGIHWINLYPVNDAIQFVNAYPLDSGLSVG